LQANHGRGVVKIGIGSYAFRWAIGTQDARPAQPMTPEGMLDQAAALGAEVVQICDNVPLSDLPDGALDALAARADRLGLELEVGIRGSRPQQLARALEVAERLGARLLRVVLADGAWRPSPDEAAALLGDLLPDLRAAEVTLAIENHFHMAPTTLAELVRTIDDPRIGVCLDPLNSIALLVGVGETVAALAPLAVSLHVKDVTVTRQGAGWAIRGCRLGEGQAGIEGVLAAVYGAGRSPNVLVEGWMDRLDDEAATLALEEDWVRQGLAYLKEWRAG
jgi:sugar phosphate isomerase/epimerase